MSDIKLPMMYAKTYGTALDARTNISASALYKYLGLSKPRRKGSNATEGIYKNGIPLLLYLDIFKNFFANTQEDKFYMLKGIGEIKLNITKTYNNNDDRIYVIGTDQKSVNIVPQTNIIISIVLTDYKDFWNSIKVKVLESDGGLYNKTLGQLTKNATRPLSF